MADHDPRKPPDATKDDEESTVELRPDAKMEAAIRAASRPPAPAPGASPTAASQPRPKRQATLIGMAVPAIAKPPVATAPTAPPAQPERTLRGHDEDDDAQTTAHSRESIQHALRSASSPSVTTQKPPATRPAVEPRPPARTQSIAPPPPSSSPVRTQAKSPDRTQSIAPPPPAPKPAAAPTAPVSKSAATPKTVPATPSMPLAAPGDRDLWEDEPDIPTSVATDRRAPPVPSAPQPKKIEALAKPPPPAAAPKPAAPDRPAATAREPVHPPAREPAREAPRESVPEPQRESPRAQPPEPAREPPRQSVPDVVEADVEEKASLSERVERARVRSPTTPAPSPPAARKPRSAWTVVGLVVSHVTLFLGGAVLGVRYRDRIRDGLQRSETFVRAHMFGIGSHGPSAHAAPVAHASPTPAPIITADVANVPSTTSVDASAAAPATPAVDAAIATAPSPATAPTPAGANPAADAGPPSQSAATTPPPNAAAHVVPAPAHGPPLPRPSAEDRARVHDALAATVAACFPTGAHAPHHIDFFVTYLGRSGRPTTVRIETPSSPASRVACVRRAAEAVPFEPFTTAHITVEYDYHP